jgi:integrase
VKPSTWLRREQFVRLYLQPALGKVKLRDLTPLGYGRLIADLKADGALSAQTIHHLHGVCHPALEEARLLELVAHYSAHGAKLPKIVKHEARTLAPDQMRAFLDATRGDRLEALYWLVLTTGMREGELCGLHWADVDLDGASLFVRTAQERDYTGYRMGTPKSERSRRPLPLRPYVVEQLRAHCARQAAERLALGAAWEDQDLVFPTATGAPMKPYTLLRRAYRPLLSRAGLDATFTFHELRHSLGTLARKLGVRVEDVSKALGHASADITQRVYIHADGDDLRDALAVLDNVFAPAVRKDARADG